MRNGYDAERAFGQGLCLEVFEDSGDKTRPLTGIGGLPCGHQVQELRFAPLQVDALGLRR